MRREAIETGETVEAARVAACRELGVEPDEAEFEILEMPVKKTLGLFGGSPAKVRAFVEEGPAEKAASYLESILNNIGLPELQIDVQKEEGGAMLSISGGDIGFIIGHRGETLDALQYLAGLVANQSEDSYYRITLDIGGYREKRRETLEALGKKLAAKAVKSGRNNSLEPMNPYERRIIHTAVQEVSGAISWSEGKDQTRHVVIGPEGGERYQPHRRSGHTGYGHQQGGRKPYGNGSRHRPSGPRNSGRPSSEQQDRHPAEECPSVPLHGHTSRDNEQQR
ncbi:MULTISPECIES: RNA-binding cell elongation regulator Jag/EloR [Caproicibacterium]|jgi:spoIIIJ-associated protein|uniref:RNA-binding protein KhpB n=1 Tax=Caproicibacterium lactatifermentans TaxID=2666138 RepID=A0A859DRQ1_9FIRM|nr:RNA-binding cell elongation regulator Jag/EloR [Caproicibacterium lactatifermentans]ARP51212.1 single-stranded DNA-binding protein [Ruminococcaceae bacterium CPB6]MDD4807221.1 protein jag [Oscillospiraceae bacterium]QKN24837.1 KH domain-containing protein [Caproicibacterium lactatifermentans]QKO31185.1 KH domain-containing protein [Caproicibacterium lactatifermentans]